MSESQTAHKFEVRALSAAIANAPVGVYVVWHPDCARAGGFANTMFRVLCSDPDTPAARGLGLPTRFRTSNSGGEPPSPVQFDAARRTVVFVLTDDHLVAASTWRTYVEDLTQSARPVDRVVPVAMTDVANLPPGLDGLQAIRLGSTPEEQQENMLVSDAIHDICRLLDPDASKVKVFLSHAKRDGVEITTTIRRHLHEVARLDEFFDVADIPDGARFADEITGRAGSTPVLLAVQTDAYASREWCRLEVLEAKRRGVPILVLAAVNEGEGRSFPYIGNVPVVRWHDATSCSAVVGCLLREVLRSRYFPLRVAAMYQYQDLPSDIHVSAYPPELLTMLTLRSDSTFASGTMSKYLYPDPPLGTAELELLRDFDPQIDPVTPTMLRAT